MVCIKYLSSKTPMCKISSSIEFKIYACIGRLLSQNTKKFPLLSEVFFGGGCSITISGDQFLQGRKTTYIMFIHALLGRQKKLRCDCKYCKKSPFTQTNTPRRILKWDEKTQTHFSISRVGFCSFLMS